MEIAQAQMGSVFQVGLMLYFFVGNQLQLFSLFFLASLGSTPVVNLLNVSNGEIPFCCNSCCILLTNCWRAMADPDRAAPLLLQPLHPCRMPA